MRIFRDGAVVGGIMLLCATAQGQTTEILSVGVGGVPANGPSKGPSMSANGGLIAFSSTATNLVAVDANGVSDVFLRDRQGGTGMISLNTLGAPGNAASDTPSISGDGTLVAFRSNASDLVQGDTNAVSDVFVHDVLTSLTVRVSVGPAGAEANGASSSPAISADGRFVAYQSGASNLVVADTNGSQDIFVTDVQTMVTELVSVRSNGAQGNSFSLSPALSADGRFVAFDSFAQNLVAGDTNGFFDIFLRDRLLGTTERVSVDSSGAQTNSDNAFSVLSPDARFVAFGSFATNLVAGDTNATLDVFLRDRQSGTTRRVSLSASGMQGNGPSSYLSAISADARFVAFYSDATNLVITDVGTNRDAFVRDLLRATTERVSVDSNGTQGNNETGMPSFNEAIAISADGRYVAFSSLASNLAGQDTNGVQDVFLHDRGPIPEVTSFCFGDLTMRPCPCANTGGAGRGCDNSASTGGAQMTSVGTASLAGDTFQLTSSGELPTALTVFMQGDEAISPRLFGDGLRCVGGILKRMQTEPAAAGVAVYPDGSEPAASVRSAALGDPIAAGDTRYYQAYYRDEDAAYCPKPTGQLWNVSSGIAATWSP